MIIRPERPGDIDTIHALTEAAFKPMPFSDGTEPDCIRKLRQDGDLTVSLIAEQNDKVVGHVAFSPVQIDGKSAGWFGLGPVSVWPHLQKQGIGGALIKHGLARIQQLGAPGCVLIGDPNYYVRFGFIGDGSLTYRDLAPEYVQWKAFAIEKPSGELTFSAGLE